MKLEERIAGDVVPRLGLAGDEPLAQLLATKGDVCADVKGPIVTDK
jgi:hypothetical protein